MSVVNGRKINNIFKLNQKPEYMVLLNNSSKAPCSFSCYVVTAQLRTFGM